MFGKKSLRLLDTCHTDIKTLFTEVIKEIDCSVICGHRTKEDQDLAFENGNSKLKWPKSKHNTFPSLAVDVVPYPIDWKDIDRFKQLMVIVKRNAKKLNIKIKCGGDWTIFKGKGDYPHYQLNKKVLNEQS